MRRLLPIFALLMIAWSMADGWPLLIAIFRNVFWVVLAILHWTIARPIGTWYAVKAMRKLDPHWQEPETLLFDEEGVRMESASARFDFPWSDLRRVLETKDVWLLHVGSKLAFLPLRVPREAGVYEELRALVERQTGKPIEQ